MRKALRISACGLSVALSGCLIGPDYTPPPLELPERFSAEAAANYRLEAPATDWWASFDDALLTELVGEALEKNKDIGQALARIDESRALRGVAVGELLPGAEVRGSYEKGENSGARFPSGAEGEFVSGFEYEVYSGSIDALWELDVFGRLRRNLEASTANVEASVASLADVQRIVAAEVAQNYFQLRGAQAQLQIAERNLAVQEESLRVAEAKYSAGETSALDASQARAQLEQTRATLPPLEADVRQFINRLAILLGRNPRQLDEKLTGPAPIPQYAGPVDIGTPAELIRRRPDVKAAERRLASETALIGVRVGELTGTLGVEAPEISQLTNGRGIYRWGPQITWRPFDFGRLRNQVKAQDARSKQALFAFEAAVLSALEDIENALARFAAERVRKSRLVAAHTAAKTAYEISQEQYRQGVTGFLNVLNAQATMLETESSVIASEQNLAVFLVGIYKALSGGWTAAQMEAREKDNKENNDSATASL